MAANNPWDVNKLRERGLAVDRQLRKLTEDIHFDPTPYSAGICREAARAYLANDLDHGRLVDRLTQKGYNEFLEDSQTQLTSVGYTLAGAGIGAAAGVGIGAMAGVAAGILFAPFTGGASIILGAELGAALGAGGGTMAGVIGGQEEASKENAIRVLGSFIERRYNLEQVLDFFLSTDLLLEPNSSEGGILAIDVFSGVSRDSYLRKQRQIAGYRLYQAFPGKKWLGHYVGWWQGDEDITGEEAVNFLRQFRGCSELSWEDDDYYYC